MKKGDFVVLFVIILGFVAVLLLNRIGKDDDLDLMIEVRINGTVVEQISLSQDLMRTYQSEFGTNTLTVKDGIVRVTDADCDDLICVDTKAAQQSGDAIVCIPNRFTVEIIGKGAEIDAIAQ